MGMNEDEWERSRKDNHKEVERRRRQTINDGITHLGELLPPDSALASGVNKAHVLTRAASYITQLREDQARTIDQWTLDKLLADQGLRNATAEIERLRRENDALRKMVVELGGSVEAIERAGGGASGAAAAMGNGGAKRAAPGGDDGGSSDGPKKARVEL
ncbi:uncharacterized protein RHOBADRAFT_39847 [Rhodotorula graminis WP1]|uniref:BHLH domain-containing protein n=1 Tax=Rhodotorula graminis (strain WP1) TaxID=578459 RepID=A0A0P9EY37_RHOGW|nr:uncharacterized protein RHOBADRAFT_39847 [Rhodotorula graminis WP1]KPV72097.1 hypothetical protein RHOBADRAFT_39847 [Rhodotorula graminis WP1]